jgi:hypothetical protein
MRKNHFELVEIEEVFAQILRCSSRIFFEELRKIAINFVQGSPTMSPTWGLLNMWKER